MKKFLVLFCASTEVFEEMSKTSPEEQKEGMEAWTNWMKDNSDSFVDEGSPVGKNLRLTKSGAEEKRNEVGGYSIMQAESAEELSELLNTGPHFDMPGAYVEVMGIVDMG